jgi:hypothetical protein
LIENSIGRSEPLHLSLLQGMSPVLARVISTIRYANSIAIGPKRTFVCYPAKHFTARPPSHIPARGSRGPGIAKTQGADHDPTAAISESRSK